MTNVCECDLALLNTGLPNCTTVHSVAERIFLVSRTDADGVVNKIPNGTTINQTYLDGKINEVAPLKRWYPIAGEFLDVEQLREDAVYNEHSNGTKAFIRKGVKNFTGFLSNFPAVYLTTLDQFKCGDWTIMFVDANGGLVGYAGANLSMVGIPLQRQTFDANFVEATDSTEAMLKVMFQWNTNTTDADIRYISPSGITGDLLNAQGLVDVIPYKTDSSLGFNVVSTTSLTFDAKTLFGTKVTGLLLADFNLNNLTTPAAIVPSAVTELPEGFYTITIAAQTTNDVLSITIAKDGLSGEQMLRYTAIAL
jgi:hypothetical protein